MGEVWNIPLVYLLVPLAAFLQPLTSTSPDGGTPGEEERCGPLSKKPFFLNLSFSDDFELS